MSDPFGAFAVACLALATIVLHLLVLAYKRLVRDLQAERDRLADHNITLLEALAKSEQEIERLKQRMRTGWRLVEREGIDKPMPRLSEEER